MAEAVRCVGEAQEQDAATSPMATLTRLAEDPAAFAAYLGLGR